MIDMNGHRSCPRKAYILQKTETNVNNDNSG